MGDINTNIRIDELESYAHNIADTLAAVPSFYKLPDMSHGGSVSKADYEAIDAAIAAGNILLTGKLTRTGAWDDKYSENVPIIGTWKNSYGDLILQTVANTLASSGSSRVIVPCTVTIEKISATTYRSMIQPQYPAST